MNSKLINVSLAELQRIEDEDYSILVNEVALLLNMIASRSPKHTIEALTTQFTLNVRYVAGLHSSITKH